MPIGDPEMAVGRLHVGALKVKRMEVGPAATSAQGESGGQAATLQLELFLLSADRKSVDEAELDSLVASTPDGPEILRRLSKYGSAHRVSEFLSAFDLSVE